MFYPVNWKKKDAPSIFYKCSTDQKSFFNKENKFAITHRYEKDVGLYLHRVQEADSGKRLEGKLLHKELLAVRNNVKWSEIDVPKRHRNKCK